MKLRQKPEDFVVDELNEFDLMKSGPYKLYCLEKRGMESFFLFSHLAKTNSIDVAEIGFAGLKDKYALTRQYLTIPADKEFKTLEEKSFKLTFLGYIKERIKSGDLQGNKFGITVRDLHADQIAPALKRAEEVRKIGMPNYFDSQRFGSAPEGEFLAKYVIRGDFEKAVKIWLTTSSESEPSRLRKEKALILKNWPKLEGLSVSSSGLSQVVNEYKSTRDWLAAYKKIPTNVRKMALSAYQSYIWNECAKVIMREVVSKESLYTVGKTGISLVFFKNLSDTEKKLLPSQLRTVGPGLEETGVALKALRQVLNKEGLQLKGFDIEEKTGDYFGVRDRPFVIIPSDLTISKPEVDELNDRGKGKVFKLTISFSLPKGSYATVVIKRIFNTS